MLDLNAVTNHEIQEALAERRRKYAEIVEYNYGNLESAKKRIVDLEVALDYESMRSKDVLGLARIIERSEFYRSEYEKIRDAYFDLRLKHAHQETHEDP